MNFTKLREFIDINEKRRTPYQRGDAPFCNSTYETFDYFATLSFNALPALNAGTLAAGILIFAPL